MGVRPCPQGQGRLLSQLNMKRKRVDDAHLNWGGQPLYSSNSNANLTQKPSQIPRKNT